MQGTRLRELFERRADKGRKMRSHADVVICRHDGTPHRVGGGLPILGLRREGQIKRLGTRFEALCRRHDAPCAHTRAGVEPSGAFSRTMIAERSGPTEMYEIGTPTSAASASR